MRTGPTRLASNKPERALLAVRVDLVDDAIDFKRQFSAVRQHVAMKLGKRLRAANRAALFGYRKAQFSEFFEKFAHGLSKISFAHLSSSISIEMKGTLSRDAAVELAQGACGGIARIDKRFFSKFLLLFVELFKVIFVHDDFASHLEHCGRKLRIYSQRNGTNRAGIGRHIFAKGSVTTRLRAHENTVFVSKINGKPVKLEFSIVDNRSIAFREPQFFTNTLVKSQGSGVSKVRFGSNG